MASEMMIAEARRADMSALAHESTMPTRPAIVPLCMLALGFAPLMVLWAQASFERPRPAAVPIAVLAGLVLAIRASRRLGRLAPGAQSWSVAAVGLGMVALVVAGFAAWPWLGMISAMAILLAGAYGTGGARLSRAVLPAWAFVALAVLPPVEMELWLVGILQTLVTACAGPVLDALGVLHLAEGNVFKIASGPLLVDEACSGVSSLFAAVGVTLYYALWTGRKPIATVVLLLTSSWWVILCNVARVVAVVFAQACWGLDLASGWGHDVWGLVIFAAVMGLTLSTDHLWRFLATLVTFRLFAPEICGRGCELRLMSSVQNVSDIPVGGRSKIIVAVVDHLLYFRIIGRGGLVVVDTDEKRLEAHARRIAYLRKQLEGLWPPHQLTDGEKVWIIAIITSMVDPTRWRFGVRSRSNARHWSPTGLDRVESSTPTEFADLGQTWLASRRLGAAFAVVGLSQVVWLWPLLARAVRGDSGAVPLQSSIATLESLKEVDLPDHLGQYVRTGFETEFHGTESSFGEFTRRWQYRSDRVRAHAAVDFPFRGWHDLTWCYAHIGWTLKERVVRTGEAPDAPAAGVFVEAVLKRPPLRHATLIYGIDDMRGDDLTPPRSADVFGFHEKLDLFRFARARLAGSPESADQSRTDSYQVQLLIQTALPLSAEQRAEAHAVFGRLRQNVRNRVTSGSVAVAKGGSS